MGDDVLHFEVENYVEAGSLEDQGMQEEAEIAAEVELVYAEV